MNNLRIALFLVLILAVIFTPAYIASIFALMLAARWRAWEVVGAGLLMDFLWMPAPLSFFPFETLPLFTLATIALVLMLEPLRRQLLTSS